MFRKVVVVGGLGQAGALLSRSLRESGIPVTLVDSRARSLDSPQDIPFLQSDVTACGPELQSLINNSDCVCVCLPEKIALEAVSKLASALPDGSLWLDTLSVKTDIVEAMKLHAGRLEVLSINPMFAPALGWPGNAVASVEVFAGPKSSFLQQLLMAWGARVEAVSAEEHDRLTAAIQVATHAAVLSFGAALLNLRPEMDKVLRISTPPHRLLLTLLYRMAMQNPEVYWDIQAFHPLGSTVRKQLLAAIEAIDLGAQDDGSQRFEKLFADLKTLFAPCDKTFREWQKRIFVPDLQ